MTRTWHKVDSLGWLDGSIRTDLTIEERSIWADFIALCSVSRIEGTICRGEKRPYDYQSLCNRLNIPLDSLTTAIAKFKQEKMIIENEYGIHLTKWAKYNPSIPTRHKPYPSKYPARQGTTTQQEEPEKEDEPTPADLEEEDYKLHLWLSKNRNIMTDDEIARAEDWEARHPEGR